MTPRLAIASQDAKSDLVNVLSSLEAHWHVLEAEVVEINRDIDYCEQCLRKYGEWFNSPLQYLRVRPAPSGTRQSSCCALPASSHQQTSSWPQQACGMCARACVRRLAATAAAGDPSRSHVAHKLWRSHLRFLSLCRS